VNNTNRNPKWFVYPFFLLHMAMFGYSGFLMAYGDSGPPFLFMLLHGGIYSQIGWLHRRLAAGVCLALAPAALA
jgi:hypothetical protein